MLLIMSTILSKIKILTTKFFIKDFIVLLLPKSYKSVTFWREYFFNIIFFFLLLLNCIPFALSTIRSILFKNYFLLIFNLSLFSILLFIHLNKKIPFYIRSYIGCSIFYFIGLFLFYKFGPVAPGLLWFFIFSIFNASFNGAKGVIYSNSVLAVTIILFNFLIPLNIFNWLFINDDFYSSNSWWLTGINLFSLNLISSISIAFFMNYLEKAIIKNVDSRNAIIFGLASLTEFRDHDTGKHLERISKYSQLLARELKKTTKYKKYITDNYIEDLEISSILHDIGKVGIEDRILLKKGKLTNEEFEKIKMHPVIGGQVIESINKKIQDKNFLKLAYQIIVYHHERWDGTGYPKGLKGSQIPLSARIVALVDVYDALISERVYKKALSHEESVKIIISENGKYFDPLLIKIFKEINIEFKKINDSLK
jgi:HD-GYP domain-containing protein (c-di-GMP phosphodiesterase class II)